MNTGQDVVIIGGGITGIASAYELARSGVSVTLFERGSLASMASGRTLAGVRQSGRHPAELPLAMAAVERWKFLAEELDADLEYRQMGNLRLAEDDDDAGQLAQLAEEQRSLGLDIQYLHGNEAVREISPAISPHIVGATFTSTDGHANPTATVHAYAEAARRQGATIRTHTKINEILVDGEEVAGVRTSEGTVAARQVVVAAGIDTPRLLDPLGISLPMVLAMVPVVRTTPQPSFLDQVIGTAKAHFAARQEVTGHVRFSSGGEPIDSSPLDVRVDQMNPTTARVAETIQRAMSIVPEIAGFPINEVWGGLLDVTPDGIPVIDRVSGLEGLTVAAGFSGHGFCLGPVSGEIIRDLVLDRPVAYSIEGFQCGRFLAHTGTSRPELLG